MKYTKDNVRVRTREIIFESIFMAIESLKLSYYDIMNMPYSMMEYLIDEKNSFTEELAKNLDNDNITLTPRR